MNILITGSDGFLGSKITRAIQENTSWNVLGLTRTMDLVHRMQNQDTGIDLSRVQYITNEEFLHSRQADWDLYGAVHLAFSRRMQPAADIASSINFAAAVFHKLADLHTDCVINMSSQGIYGNTPEIRTEETLPAPETHYSMAKYASEILFNDILRDCPHHTNLRLDPVAQSQNVLQGLIKSAKEGVINLKGGKQVFSFIDADDVPSAVISMLKSKGDWDLVYNVGWNRKRYTLIELANLIADETENVGYQRPVINIENAEIFLWAGLDSTKFREKTGWTPVTQLSDTVKKMLLDCGCKHLRSIWNSGKFLNWN